jgi:hypothetical protein
MPTARTHRAQRTSRAPTVRRYVAVGAVTMLANVTMIMVAVGPATTLKDSVNVAMPAVTALGVAQGVTIRAEAQLIRRQ